MEHELEPELSLVQWELQQVGWAMYLHYFLY